MLAEGYARYRGEPVLRPPRRRRHRRRDRRRRRADQRGRGCPRSSRSDDALTAPPAARLHAYRPTCWPAPRPRRARRTPDPRVRRARPSRSAPEIAVTTRVRRARVHRAGGRLRRARRRRIDVFACTQTPYMDRDELAPSSDLARAVRIVPSASAAASAASSTSPCNRSLAVAAWSWAVRSACLQTAGVHAADHQAPPGTMQARPPATPTAGWSPSFPRRLQHRRVFVVGADGRQPRADPRERAYALPHVRALTRAVLTHHSVAGAFRGFGVPQSTLSASC